MNKSKQLFWVGIDGGGTKCRAVLYDAQGEALAEGLGGPANIARYQHLALESMLDAVKAAVAQAGLMFDDVCQSLTVCAGLAGAFLPSSQTLRLRYFRKSLYAAVQTLFSPGTVKIHAKGLRNGTRRHIAAKASTAINQRPSLSFTCMMVSKSWRLSPSTIASFGSFEASTQLASTLACFR